MDIAEYTSKLPKKFCNRLVFSDTCWLWQGPTKHNQGYGRFSYKGKAWLTHRLSYFLAYDVDPDELCVCHKCDVRNCVNPEHLFLGTRRDNFEDMRAKHGLYQDKKTHCAQGHDWIDVNIYTNKNGVRQCIHCKRSGDRVRQLKYYHAKKLDSHSQQNQTRQKSPQLAHDPTPRLIPNDIKPND